MSVNMVVSALRAGLGLIPLCSVLAQLVLAEYFMNKGEVVTLTMLPQVKKHLILAPTRHMGNACAHL